MGLCLILVLLFSTDVYLLLQSSCLGEKHGSSILIGFRIFGNCKCYLALPRGAMGKFVV